MSTHLRFHFDFDFDFDALVATAKVTASDPARYRENARAPEISRAYSLSHNNWFHTF